MEEKGFISGSFVGEGFGVGRRCWVEGGKGATAGWRVEGHEDAKQLTLPLCVVKETPMKEDARTCSWWCLCSRRLEGRWVEGVMNDNS